MNLQRDTALIASTKDWIKQVSIGLVMTIDRSCLGSNLSNMYFVNHENMIAFFPSATTTK